MRTTDPFDALLQRHRGLLFTLCRRYCRRSIDFDDLLQEATLALWRAREKILPLPTAVQQAAMVWKISKNAIIDTLRRTRDSDPLPDTLELPDDDKSLVKELHEQIALLDEPDRTIVQLQLQGYSYEEIAGKVGMSEKNISVRLVRIREKLRKAFI